MKDSNLKKLLSGDNSYVDEFRLEVYNCVDSLFKKRGISCKDIEIVKQDALAYVFDSMSNYKNIWDEGRCSNSQFIKILTKRYLFKH